MTFMNLFMIVLILASVSDSPEYKSVIHSAMWEDIEHFQSQKCLDFHTTSTERWAQSSSSLASTSLQIDQVDNIKKTILTHYLICSLSQKISIKNESIPFGATQLSEYFNPLRYLEETKVTRFLFQGFNRGLLDLRLVLCRANFRGITQFDLINPD